MSPRRIAAVALRRGLTAIAITDHNTMAGCPEMQAAAGGLRIICGEEIRTAQGELTGYFLSEQIPPGLSPRETVARIRGQGGLVGVPHPFDRLRSSRLQPGALAALVGSLDMIEIFNARNIFVREDRELLGRVLAAGALPIAASDAHLPVEVGRACMEMDDFTTPQEFMASLRTATIRARKSPLWVHAATKVLKKYRRLCGP